MAKVNLYRITHIQNIPHILNFGITGKNSQNRNGAFTSIGDVSLISTRSTKSVHITNGDILAGSIESIVLGDFIPFYFGVRMPMLYVVQNGGNFVNAATNPSEIVYVVCGLNKVLDVSNSFYFADGHATDSFTSFYNRDRIGDLEDILDWDAIKTKYWGGSENLNLKRKKQAEFLVENDLPIDCINGYGCYNNEASINLQKMGVDASLIKIIPNAYF